MNVRSSYLQNAELIYCTYVTDVPIEWSINVSPAKTGKALYKFPQRGPGQSPGRSRILVRVLTAQYALQLREFI